jgi:hypothetical protein
MSFLSERPVEGLGERADHAIPGPHAKLLCFPAPCHSAMSFMSDKRVSSCVVAAALMSPLFDVGSEHAATP